MSFFPSQLTTAVLIAASVVSVRSAFAVEEPSFEVVESDDVVELRRYAPFLMAETEVAGGFADAGETAFRVLFGYISGANGARAKIAMTAPVVQQPILDRVSDASLAEPAGGGWRVGFVVPSDFDRETVPVPADPRVSIREVPGRLVVAVRFTGRWTADRFEEHQRLAEEWAAVHDYAIAGGAVWARYNPPFTPWFMRRNEVLLPVQPVTDRSE